MRIPVSALLCLVYLAPSLANETDATGDTGQFQYRITQIDLTWKPGFKTYFQATVGFQITNTGKFPVRIALVPNWPTVQLEGASVQLQLRSGGLSGMAFSNDNRISQCPQAAENFTILRPNYKIGGNLILDAYTAVPDLPLAKRARFSAILMVQSLDDKKCWIEPFSVLDVPVNVHS